ncbi:hypothetical protein Tco_0804756 [Tanacetum coccineum]|uniref:Reverse transcriptase domain-containing protein n=1 Tax=Tanacetum coccineum TaxID=301880 RepID=A0ABQ5A9S1_9ASTR
MPEAGRGRRVSGSTCPYYIPGPEEDEILPAEEQPLPASPTADSPGYVPESDLEEEPEEDDEDPKEDPADYPADRDDDDDEDEDEEEEEEEHLASADFVPPVHYAWTIEPEITLPPQKRLGIDLCPRYEIGGSSAAAATRPIRGRRADYGFVNPREAVEEVAPMTLGGVHREILALRSGMMGQQAEISQLQAADRESQGCDLEMLHGRLPEQSHLDPAKGPAQPDALGEAGSSSNLLCLSFVQVMINEGITAALAARDATRNSDDSHTSGTGARRPVGMNGYSKRKPKMTKPSTGWKRQSKSEANALIPFSSPKRPTQQVRQTSVEPPNLENPNNNQEIFNSPIVTMDDNRTMAQLLEAPTEGYEDAIVVPEINANNFEIKHGLLNLVQNKQFFGHDKEDPHAHIRYFNKITSTMKFPKLPEYS